MTKYAPVGKVWQFRVANEGRSLSKGRKINDHASRVLWRVGLSLPSISTLRAWSLRKEMVMRTSTRWFCWFLVPYNPCMARCPAQGDDGRKRMRGVYVGHVAKENERLFVKGVNVCCVSGCENNLGLHSCVSKGIHLSVEDRGLVAGVDGVPVYNITCVTANHVSPPLFTVITSHSRFVTEEGSESELRSRSVLIDSARTVLVSSESGEVGGRGDRVGGGGVDIVGV